MKGVCFVFLAVFTGANAKLTGLLLNVLLSAFLSVVQNPQEDEVQSSAAPARFFLSTRRRPQPEELSEDLGNLQLVDPRHPVKVIVHGWLENAQRPWVRNMTQEFLKKGECNVIQVDYARTAAERYGVAAASVRNIGGFIGRLITILHSNYGVSLHNVHIIGHSLGAHVSGGAGKEVSMLTGYKLPRITALDAAGPYFETPPLFAARGLSRDDALVVDAIHTDGNLFGYFNPIGTVDFYPNGGVAVQPGCPSIVASLASVAIDSQQGLDELFCSHTKSYHFYISSINGGSFVSKKCSAWREYVLGNCERNIQTIMGDPLGQAGEVVGVFFLKTLSFPPYISE